MNVMGSLLNRLNADEDDRTPEEIAAEEKAERIEFHRKHVRNGPTNFRTVTGGQVRRAERRSRRSQARKASKRYRRSWMIAEQRQAFFRGQLQAAGVLPLHDGTFADPNPAIVRVLVKDHGSVVEAKKVWDDLQARKVAEAKREIAKAMREQGTKQVPKAAPEQKALAAGFAK